MKETVGTRPGLKFKDYIKHFLETLGIYKDFKSYAQ